MLSGMELKLHRVKKKLKAKSVADYLGLHYSYISKLESEVQSIPKHVYEKWVEYLGIDVNK